MDPWDSVLRTRTELSAPTRDHLTQLVREWSLLADLSFSDLVLLVRTWDAAGWYVASHVRPSTAATVLPHDPVGSFLPRSHAPALERVLQSGEIVRGPASRGARLGGPSGAEPIEAVPVPHAGRVQAVIARYSLIDRRRLGELEQQYLAAGDVLFGMVARGEFPMPDTAKLGAAAPRVGDGLLRLDSAGAVRYASPNARSCLRAYGVAEPVTGSDLADDLVRFGRRHAPIDQEAVQVARGEVAGEAEFASTTAILTLRSIPLMEPDRSAGAVVLIRDVSDARRQEQALLSKEATIREIHHRVKNNLQTVGALLRLQARRMPAGAGRTALLDAVARVGTIALVHDSLSRSPGADVDFDEICGRILAMAQDAAAAQEGPVATRIRVDGSFGVLPAGLATPLAMVLAELLLNAMEHSGAQRVVLAVRRAPDRITTTVCDDGVGFDPASVEGLGLQIVATLVREQLQGHLTISSGPYPRWPAESLEQERGPQPEAHTPGPEEFVTKVMVSCPL